MNPCLDVSPRARISVSGCPSLPTSLNQQEQEGKTDIVTGIKSALPVRSEVAFCCSWKLTPKSSPHLFPNSPPQNPEIITECLLS